MGVILPSSTPEYSFPLAAWIEQIATLLVCDKSLPTTVRVIGLRMKKQSFMIVLPSCAHDHPSFELRNDLFMSDS